MASFYYWQNAGGESLLVNAQAYLEVTTGADKKPGKLGHYINMFDKGPFSRALEADGFICVHQINADGRPEPLLLNSMNIDFVVSVPDGNGGCHNVVHMNYESPLYNITETAEQVSRSGMALSLDDEGMGHENDAPLVYEYPDQFFQIFNEEACSVSDFGHHQVAVIRQHNAKYAAPDIAHLDEVVVFPHPYYVRSQQMIGEVRILKADFKRVSNPHSQMSYLSTRPVENLVDLKGSKTPFGAYGSNLNVK